MNTSRPILARYQSTSECVWGILAALLVAAAPVRGQFVASWYDTAGYFGDWQALSPGTKDSVAPFLSVLNPDPASFPQEYSHYPASSLAFGQPTAVAGVGSRWELTFDPYPYFEDSVRYLSAGDVFSLGTLTVFNGVTTTTSAIELAEIQIRGAMDLSWDWDLPFWERWWEGPAEFHETLSLKFTHTPNSGEDPWADADGLTFENFDYPSFCHWCEDTGKMFYPQPCLEPKTLHVLENSYASVEILARADYAYGQPRFRVLGFGNVIAGDGVVLPEGQPPTATPVPEPVHTSLAVGLGIATWALCRRRPKPGPGR